MERENLCEKMAYCWRTAENLYLDSDYSNCRAKDLLKDFQKNVFSQEEQEEIILIAESMGV